MVLLKLLYCHKVKGSVKKSTFHYGSIKIQRERENVRVYLLSTFHYGSIKIMIITNRGFGKT